MSLRPLHTLFAVALIATTALCGCRSGKKSEAKPIDEPRPSLDSYLDESSRLPPLPSLGESRPRLLPGGPSAPLESPSRSRSSSTNRSALSGPSLPLPAPPAEEF